MISIASPDIGEDEKKAVMDVMSSGMIAEGPKVKEFEAEFAKYIGTDYAVAVSSGTAALHIALLANDIGPKDEVITSPFTFIASSNSVLFTGAKPVFADINEDTFNIDPDCIRKAITEKTKAIMPVHLYGQPCDMDAIKEIAKEHNLKIIEDACQAHGAEYKGKKVGSFGEGCFSFYPTKNMTTSEGGIITTNSEEINTKAKAIRQHGMMRRYYHDMLGFNLRMTDIAAAIGLTQLKKLEKYNNSRISNAKYLSENIVNPTITTPKISENCKHVFHQYTIKCEDRENVQNALKAAEIGYGVYYPLPIHNQPYYKEIGYDESHPVAEKIAEICLSLPVHPKLTKENLEKIVETLNDL